MVRGHGLHGGTPVLRGLHLERRARQEPAEKAAVVLVVIDEQNPQRREIRRLAYRAIIARQGHGRYAVWSFFSARTRSRSSAACSKSRRRAASRIWPSSSAMRFARSAGDSNASSPGLSTSTVT